MKQNLSPLRPAMTAIAAVIALSSTPLLAQATDSTAAPVVVAPPPPTVAPAAATPTPEATAPAPVEAVPAPAPAMKTVGTPVVHEADTAPEVSQSAAAPTRTAPVKRTSTAPSARASAPVATASLAPTKSVPAKVEATPAPVPAPVAKTVPTPAPAATSTPPAPVTTATQTTRASTVADETLPIAGGIGLAVLALGGAAYAVSRRRRENEEGELVLGPTPAAIPVTEPVVVAKAAPASKTHRRTPKTLPSGFDISRFGPHTQAAYLGPTDDNPSFSLKRRLKRASFFDQREREAAEANVQTTAATVEAPAQAAAAKTVRDDGQVTIRLAPQRKRGGLGYLLQR